jgi:hypothetical protein
MESCLRSFGRIFGSSHSIRNRTREIVFPGPNAKVFVLCLADHLGERFSRRDLEFIKSFVLCSYFSEPSADIVRCGYLLSLLSSVLTYLFSLPYPDLLRCLFRQSRRPHSLNFKTAWFLGFGSGGYTDKPCSRLAVSRGYRRIQFLPCGQ